MLQRRPRINDVGLLAAVAVLALAGPLAAYDGRQGPMIDIVAPRDGAVLTAPVDVDIRFRPADGTEIDAASLRVTVETWWTVDITDKVKPHLQGNVISIDGADIPTGEHSITISIADEDGRRASRTVEVMVR